LIKNAPLYAACALAAFIVAGCNRQPPTPAQEPAAAPAPVEPQAQAPAPVEATPAPVRVDPFSQDELKVGLDAITPRIVATVDGYEKVAPRADARFTLHPDMEKNASIEFDISGLTTLTLSPYMGDFSTVPDCAGNPDAGIARLRWSLDGGAPNEVMVDRNYAATILIDTLGAKRLKVEADKGNEQNWCDWLGLGVAKVQ
jgi:hypothetical protein